MSVSGIVTLEIVIAYVYLNTAEGHMSILFIFNTNPKSSKNCPYSCKPCTREKKDSEYLRNNSYVLKQTMFSSLSCECVDLIVKILTTFLKEHEISDKFRIQGRLICLLKLTLSQQMIFLLSKKCNERSIIMSLCRTELPATSYGINYKQYNFLQGTQQNIILVKQLKQPECLILRCSPRFAYSEICYLEALHLCEAVIRKLACETLWQNIMYCSCAPSSGLLYIGKFRTVHKTEIVKFQCSL